MVTRPQPSLLHRIIEREAPLAPSVFLDRDAWVHVWDKAEREEHARCGQVEVPAGTGTVHVRFAEAMDGAGGVRIYVWPSWPALASVCDIRWREGSDIEGFDVTFSGPSPAGGALAWVVRRLEDVEVREHAPH